MKIIFTAVLSLGAIFIVSAQNVFIRLVEINPTTLGVECKVASPDDISGTPDCLDPSAGDLVGGNFNFTIGWTSAVESIDAVAESVCETGYNISGQLRPSCTCTDCRTMNCQADPFLHPFDWPSDTWVIVCTINVVLAPSPQGDDVPLALTDELMILTSADFVGLSDPYIVTSVNEENIFEPFELIFTVEDEPLPLTLLSFSANKVDDNSALLDWVTVEEYNTSHFLVQRSEDAKNWVDLGAVDAAGQSTEARSYSFMDRNVYDGRRPNMRYYYRLVMIDKDGKFNISNIDVVKFSNVDEGNTTVFIYPNPSSVGLNVEFAQGEGGLVPARMEMFNTLGQMVFSRVLNEETEIEYIHYANSGIGSGSFFLRVSDKDGQVISPDQVVVTR